MTLLDECGSTATATAALGAGGRGRQGLGVQPRDETGEARFSTVVHWAYGTSWGLVVNSPPADRVDAPHAQASR